MLHQSLAFSILNPVITNISQSFIVEVNDLGGLA